MLFAFGAAVAAQARTGTIRGVVNDREWQAPLGGATVSILETGQAATTDEQGACSLAEVRPGRYTVVFAKDGYVRFVRTDVVVAPGQLTEIAVDLSADRDEMDEFIVQDLQLGAGTESALLQLRLESPSLLDSISSDLMSRAGASDAAAALPLIAGASVQNGKSAVIRGLPDRYVSSQMNGVRLPTAEEDKRAVELDQFPSSVIQTIQVSKTFTPDQQGDASGGAVDVRLKGIPDEPLFFQLKTEASRNSQVGNRHDFLTYRGGGVNFWGKDDGGRDPQLDRIGQPWSGAVGTTRTDAPIDSQWSMAMGGRRELGQGMRVGGFASVYYKRDSSFSSGGIDDSSWVTNPGDPMTPRQLQLGGATDFKTALFDVTRATELVRWGGLATLGFETDHHRLTAVALYTQVTEDSATLAEDTRGKQFFYPGFDPNDQNSPGHTDPDAAPYLRLETLQYTERKTTTLQLHGSHDIDVVGDKPPVFEWTIAHSDAGSFQPDKRQFGERWVPGRTIVLPNPLPPLVQDPLHLPYKPAANINLGNLQRIFKSIDETSDEYAADLKVPFVAPSATDGYVKVGLFHDRVTREFNQDTYANFGDANAENGFAAPFETPWSSVFGADPINDPHPIGESQFDVDYHGRQELSAFYAMADLPVTDRFNLIGGVRFEATSIDIVNDPEALATWLPLGSLAQTQLNPGDADVAFAQHDALPAIGLVGRLTDQVTLRLSYAQTVARQTFKELTPILQQEFLGGPIFVGNPELRMSALDNYDVRLDWAPYEGGLVSGTWFRKDIDGPIEYVQRPAEFDVTTAVNYPKGRLEGFEFEVRQKLGEFVTPLDGLTVGANATFIHSEVTLPEDEVAGFALPNIRAPITSRDMTNAPNHLYNAFVTYELGDYGTRAGLFYTIQGDTLIAGAGQAGGNFVPSVYATQFDTLNFSLSQSLGDFAELTFGAKNLTNPDIETVYRSQYIGADVAKTRTSRGVEYLVSIGGTLRF